jgi:hypothetical protein
MRRVFGKTSTGLTGGSIREIRVQPVLTVSFCPPPAGKRANPAILGVFSTGTAILTIVSMAMTVVSVAMTVVIMAVTVVIMAMPIVIVAITASGVVPLAVKMKMLSGLGTTPAE